MGLCRGMRPRGLGSSLFDRARGRAQPGEPVEPSDLAVRDEQRTAPAWVESAEGMGWHAPRAGDVVQHLRRHRSAGALNICDRPSAFTFDRFVHDTPAPQVAYSVFPPSSPTMAPKPILAIVRQLLDASLAKLLSWPEKASPGWPAGTWTSGVWS